MADIDQVRRRPVFQDLYLAPFQKTQEKSRVTQSTWQIQIYNGYFRFIFDIGLDYCKFLSSPCLKIARERGRFKGM